VTSQGEGHYRRTRACLQQWLTVTAVVSSEEEHAVLLSDAAN